MKQLMKTKYVLEQSDKKEIRKQLIDLDLSIRKLAKNIGYHYSYLCDVFNGHKCISKNLIDALNSQGIVI